MLPRITQAISKFLTPIASSLSGDSRRQKDPEFQQFKKKHPTETSKPSNPGKGSALSAVGSSPGGSVDVRVPLPSSNETPLGSPLLEGVSKDTDDGMTAPGQSSHLKLVPPPDENGQPVSTAAAPGPSTTAKPSAASHAIQSWTQIFSLFQAQAAPISRWMGAAAYQRGQKSKKKGGKFRKGSILDYRED